MGRSFYLIEMIEESSMVNMGLRHVGYIKEKEGLANGYKYLVRTTYILRNATAYSKTNVIFSFLFVQC